MVLGKIISFFILFTGTRYIFAGIDATGFKITYASEYYTNRAKLKRRKQYAKLSIYWYRRCSKTDNLQGQGKTSSNTTRHDNIDFKPIVTKISKIKPLAVVVTDKGYDSEDNHGLVREKLNGFSVIPSIYEKDVPIWKTRGKYRKSR